MSTLPKQMSQLAHLNFLHYLVLLTHTITKKLEARLPQEIDKYIRPSGSRKAWALPGTIQKKWQFIGLLHCSR